MKIPPYEALQLFKAIKREGLYQTDHFQMRAMERGFTMEDVFEVADNGDISKRSPTYKAKHKDWSYTMIGKDIDGERITIVFAVTSDREVKLITGYRGKYKGKYR